MRQLLRHPVFDSPDQTRRAQLVFITAWATMLIVTPFMALVGALRIGPDWRAILVILFVDSLGLSVLAANRAGHTRPASWALVVGLIGLATALALSAGGIRAQGITVFLPVVLMAGILLGEPAGTATGLACIAIGLGFVLADRMGLIPETIVHQTPFSLWVGFGLFLGLVISLQRLATSTIGASLARATAEIEERRRAETGLQQALDQRDHALDQLAKRMRELQLLHATTRLLQDGRPFDRELLAELVPKIPRAWQHPECCEARITHGDIEVATPGFRETRWMQSATFGSAPFSIRVDVAYLGERPTAHEGPFLAEERVLLQSLGELLLTYAAQQGAGEARARLELQLRQTQKMEALGALAGGIAHDFNNILTSISGNTQLALDELAPDHPAYECVAEIKKGSGRASELVRTITTFSVQRETRRRPLLLTPVVDEALSLLRPVLKGTRIRTCFGGDVTLVNADPTQIHQVVMNLGANAGFAMMGKAGELSVSLDSVRVDAARAAPDLPVGTYARLMVTDTGIGMGPDVMQRVFEPFFTTREGTGTGLGLAIVQGIVAEHEGAIRVRSERGAGTTFEVYLPGISGEAVPEPDASAVIAQGRGERFLVVDNDEAVIDLMKRMLKRIGYVATGLNDAQVALHVFAAAPDAFDAVIANQAMPEMNGTELAAAIHAIRPDLPIALMSGRTGLEASALVDHAAIRGFIPKPCGLEDLSVRLRALLETNPQGTA